MQHLVNALRLQAAIHPGNAVTRRILDAGLQPEQIWDEQVMAAHGIKPLKDSPPEAAQRLLGQLEEAGIGLLTMWDERYPPLLRQIYAPPAVLFFKGTLPDWQQAPAVAIVGTRHCSEQGGHTAHMLAQGFAAGGAIVVSGGAVGIDKAAHLGALQAGGITVAVMPCGVDVSYPAANRLMREDIVQHGGLLLSEYPPGCGVNKGSFAMRNRLIAGICAATCVVEAPQPSGALNTARWARDQGRDLYVVAGPLSDEGYAGSHALLRDGADVLLDAGLVLQGLQGRFAGSFDAEKATRAQLQAAQQQKQAAEPSPPPAPEPVPEVLQRVECPPYASDAAKQMYRFLADGPLPLPQLAEKAGCTVGAALAQMTELEILGCVVPLPGPAYAIRETGRNR